MIHRYTVLVGNYGSGKTELAIAMARAVKKAGSRRVALVDMDIVNPYFRSGEQRALLEGEGVEVFMPTFAMSTVDIPALPATIQGVFEQDFSHVVIDVGGDDTGATALGRYAPYIQPIRHEMVVYDVVNPFRPLSGTAEDIAALYSLICERARLKPDALINNGNLQELTTADNLIEAQAVVEKAARRLGLPVAAVAGREALRRALPEGMQSLFFAFEPVMKPDWLVERP